MSSTRRAQVTGMPRVESARRPHAGRPDGAAAGRRSAIDQAARATTLRQAAPLPATAPSTATVDSLAWAGRAGGARKDCATARVALGAEGRAVRGRGPSDATPAASWSRAGTCGALTALPRGLCRPPDSEGAPSWGDRGQRTASVAGGTLRDVLCPLPAHPLLYAARSSWCSLCVCVACKRACEVAIDYNSLSHTTGTRTSCRPTRCDATRVRVARRSK